MKRRHAHLRRLARDIAQQRIRYLYKIAVNAAREGEHDYAATLGRLVREIAARNRVRLPKSIKRALCKNCGLPLIPGVTARVRLKSQGPRFSYTVITCMRCGWIHRYPYKKGRGARGLGGSKGEGEEGAPLEPRRHNREEGRDEGGARRDRQEARG